MSQLGARQLRNRPIDINKKLFIIRDVKDLERFEGEHGVRIDPAQLGFNTNNSYICSNDNDSNRDLTSLPFSSNLIPGSIHKNSSHGNISNSPAKKSKVIVVPSCTTITDSPYANLQPFVRPDHYIRLQVHKEFVTGIKLDDNTIVHFDMLRPDDEFLKNLNKGVEHGNKLVLTETDFCKMIDRFEKQSGRWGEGRAEINFLDALKVTKDLRINVEPYIVREVYNHWKGRRAKLCRPLLRQFWPQSSIHDTSAFAVFRPRIKDKMTLRKPKKDNGEVIMKMTRLIDDFRRVERILKKIKQRDEKKLIVTEVDELLFDQMRHQITDKSYRCPHWDHFKEVRFGKGNKRNKKDRHHRDLLAAHSNLLKYPSPIFENIGNRHIRESLVSPLGAGNVRYNSTINNLSRHPFRLIRRKGRGGRIWLDRRQLIFTRENYNMYKDFVLRESGSFNPPLFNTAQGKISNINTKGIMMHANDRLVSSDQIEENIYLLPSNFLIDLREKVKSHNCSRVTDMDSSIDYIDSEKFNLFGMQSYIDSKKVRLEVLDALISDRLDEEKVSPQRFHSHDYNISGDLNGLDTEEASGTSQGGYTQNSIYKVTNDHSSETIGDATNVGMTNDKKRLERDRLLHSNLRNYMKYYFPVCPRTESSTS